MTIARKRLECTLLFTLFFVLCYAVFCQFSQMKLAEDIVRLRVVANSDSETDQQVKLTVRDAVLNEISSWDERPASADEMMTVLSAHRADIDSAVASTLTSCGASAEHTVVLAEDYYPTREYQTFSLPAGDYQGLKIYLGDGAGQNWWCVIYPSLCLDAAGAEEDLSDDERGLIHQGNSEYIIRFRTAEALGELKALLCDS